MINADAGGGGEWKWTVDGGEWQENSQSENPKMKIGGRSRYLVLFKLAIIVEISLFWKPPHCAFSPFYMIEFQRSVMKDAPVILFGFFLMLGSSGFHFCLLFVNIYFTGQV